MKLFIVLSTVLAIGSFVASHNDLEEKNESLRQCFREHGVTSDLDLVPDEANFKFDCWYSCYLQAEGMMNKNGSLNKTNIMSTEEFSEADVDQAIDFCNARLAKESADDKEYPCKYADCLINHAELLPRSA